jgi:hypothetical protein
MAAELNEDRRALVQDAAEDAGMTVEVDDLGEDWHLEGPATSIYRFFARVAARNSVFAELLADCIEDGTPVTLTRRTWLFPAWGWGERIDDEDDWADIDIDEEDEAPAPASDPISAEETTQP